MFDMSWGEIMLIGGVALVVIGPKDLPRALRTVGQITGKLKRMAGEFQVQFNEAMREADLDDARREVEGLNRSVSTFNPVQTIRNEIKGAVDASSRPAPGALAAATAQLQADQAQAGTDEAAPTADPPGHGTEVPAAPPPPRPSIDGAPLVAPEAAAGLEVAAPPAAPETVPPASPHGEAHAPSSPLPPPSLPVEAKS